MEKGSNVKQAYKVMSCKMCNVDDFNISMLNDYRLRLECNHCGQLYYLFSNGRIELNEEVK